MAETVPNEQENEISQAAFADLRGVSRPMVTRWKQRGRLVMNADASKVLVRESIELLDQTLDPARGGDRTGQQGRTERQLPPPASSERYRGGRDHDYHAAARIEKLERAAMLKLDRMEREGELVSRRQVEIEAQARATQAREALIAIPDRLASQLAAESDADKVRAMLEGEIRHVINQLAVRAPEQVGV